jgi:hypothetical protein
MFSFIKKLFGITPSAIPMAEAANQAPYKVPEPAAITLIPLVAKITPKKKPAPKKQQFAKKAPAVKTVVAPAKKAGRKPKTKPAQ